MAFKNLKRLIKHTNKNQDPMNNRKRVGMLLFATSIGLFFLFAGRFAYVVIGGHIAGTSLAEKTKNLYNGEQTIKARRGTIYDRNGNVIAIDSSSYSLYVVLSEKYVAADKTKLYAQSSQFEAIAKIISDNTGTDEASVLKTLQDGKKNDAYQVEFASTTKNLSLETKEKIEAAMDAADMRGVYFTESADRSYPNGVFASHFIGYVSTDDNDIVGKMGLEAAYDDLLKGTDGKVEYQKDSTQNPIPGTVKETKTVENGQDIYTTLDSGLQSYLETLMDQVYGESKPEDLTAVLMEAKTGDVLAMSQRPTFNPETLDGITDNWKNLFVEDSYEPGSTMKVFTVSAAVNEDKFDANATYNPVGGITVGGDTTINDHDFGEKGILTYRQALSWSSNVGMVHVEENLGDTLQDYFQKFGFGQSTYSGLFGETVGKLPGTNIVDRAMSAYGQAVSVTQFQMLRGFSAVANDGKMLQPHFISKIVDTNTNKEKVIEPEVVGNPITSETAATVRQYMRDVVESENYGTAYGKYSVDDYHISAKTGTAQIASPTGGYMTGSTNNIFSIVLMLPSEDPEYVLYITMKKPDKYPVDELPSIANPLLKRAMDFQDTSAPTATKEDTEKIEVADYRSMAVEDAAADAQKQGLAAVVIGNGAKVKEQSSDVGAELMPNERLLFLTDGDKLMPDVTGWSKSDLMKLASLLDMKVSFDGEGYCTGQNIDAYAKITGKELKFTLG